MNKFLNFLYRLFGNTTSVGTGNGSAFQKVATTDDLLKTGKGKVLALRLSHEAQSSAKNALVAEANEVHALYDGLNEDLNSVLEQL